MDTPPATTKYKNHRFPVEIISHAVWLYFRFCLSFRDVEELLLERGVVVTYEAIRKWCGKFGQQYANQLRRRRPRPGDKWHMDEVFLTIKGERQYLWRAVDQNGNVLDILVQRRRDKRAAKKFFRKLLKRRFQPIRKSSLSCLIMAVPILAWPLSIVSWVERKKPEPKRWQSCRSIPSFLWKLCSNGCPIKTRQNLNAILPPCVRQD